VELAVLVVAQGRLLAEQARLMGEQAALIEVLRAELAAARGAAGRDSSGSSSPPGKDGPGAKAEAWAEKRWGSGESAGSSRASGAGGSGGQAERGRGERRQGGQPGHRGSGLARVAEADRQEPVEPRACAGGGAGLAGADGSVAWSVPVFDLPTPALTVTEYLMMRRVCACGGATTADLPVGGRGGPACYGPNVTAAATWPASQDVIGVARAADMTSTLLGAPVSTGFVSSCLARLEDALTAAGFEEALKAALCEQPVLGTEETPAPGACQMACVTECS
jgi:transposase